MFRADLTWSGNIDLEEEARKLKEEGVTDLLTKAANTAVDISPIDTGAYILSHQITSGGAGRPRGKSTRGRKRGGGESAREEARSQLMSDISRVNFDSDTFTIRNGAPHAVYVEYGNQHYSGYQVYEQLQNILGGGS